MTTEIFFAISTGLITAFLATICGWMLRDSIFPRLHSIIYRGPNISGKWSSFYNESPDSQMIGECLVTQFGSKINAKAVSNTSRSGESKTRHWNMSGKFSNGKLVLSYEDVDLPNYTVGVGLFTLSDDGKSLAGKVMYQDKDSHEVQAKPFMFKRP